MTVLLLLLGIYLGMRCVVALHAVVDLVYDWRRHGLRMGAGLVIWWGGSALLALLLPPDLRQLLLAAMFGYLLLYLGGALLLGHVLLPWRWRQARRRDVDVPPS